MDSLKQVGRKVQGGLPIVGLLSRLSSPSGGFDDVVRTLTCFCVVLRTGHVADTRLSPSHSHAQSYPEFARKWIDQNDAKLNQAIEKLEQRHQKVRCAASTTQSSFIIC